MLGFCFFSFVVLFYTHKENKTLYLNYLAWLVFIVVILLEIIFLIELLLTGNTFELTKTNYATMRIQYIHSIG